MEDTVKAWQRRSTDRCGDRRRREHASRMDSRTGRESNDSRHNRLESAAADSADLN